MSINTKALGFLSDLVVYNKYASYIPDEQRRQTFNECIDSVKNMHIKKFPHIKDEILDAFKEVYGKKVLPSMRSIQFGGLPIELAPNKLFNCSFSNITHEFIFAELAFLLLGGTGAGYSVKSRHIKKLPMIKKPDGVRRFLIMDSIEGWADSIKQLTYAYFRGKILPEFDYRDIRPEGSPIKKSGGIAPGPSKLMLAHKKIKNVFDGAINRRLKSIEVHDIICYIAECIVSGGVRSSAMIALFDPSDTSMALSKSYFRVKDFELKNQNSGFWIYDIILDETQGDHAHVYGEDVDAVLPIYVSKQYGEDIKEKLENENLIPWYYIHPQRSMSNNSMSLRRGNVTKKEFYEYFKNVEDSEYGEPGIYWQSDPDYGCNPCGEISLDGGSSREDGGQFCNLSTVSLYGKLTQDDLNKRARAAAFIGTLQASYTDFHYLRVGWQNTTERDALLGVSLTNIACSNFNDLDFEEAAREVKKENERVSQLIGINPAARLTCIKPEGTGTLAISTLGNGIHSILHKYLYRTIRIKKSQAIYEYLKDKLGRFIEDEYGNEADGAVVFIPLKAPDGSITAEESAMDMLNRIRKFSDEWIKSGHTLGVDTHNVSATVYVKDNEWEDVKKWMWDNRNHYNGITCLPYNNKAYKQAPYIPITKEEYDKAIYDFPENINLTEINEELIGLDLVSELACSGGSCEIK
jgi:hypothetical protein